jgi:hypothetical protein
MCWDARIGGFGQAALVLHFGWIPGQSCPCQGVLRPVFDSDP